MQRTSGVRYEFCIIGRGQQDQASIGSLKCTDLIGFVLSPALQMLVLIQPGGLAKTTEALAQGLRRPTVVLADFAYGGNVAFRRELKARTQLTVCRRGDARCGGVDRTTSLQRAAPGIICIVVLLLTAPKHLTE